MVRNVSRTARGSRRCSMTSTMTMSGRVVLPSSLRSSTARIPDCAFERALPSGDGSTATTSAPASRNAALIVPIPAPKSRTRRPASVSVAPASALTRVLAYAGGVEPCPEGAPGAKSARYSAASASSSGCGWQKCSVHRGSVHVTTARPRQVERVLRPRTACRAAGQQPRRHRPPFGFRSSSLEQRTAHAA